MIIKGLQWVGFGMANARNGERFLTGMANAYGRNGENAIIVCYDLKYKMKYKVYVLQQL